MKGTRLAGLGMLLLLTASCASAPRTAVVQTEIFTGKNARTLRLSVSSAAGVELLNQADAFAAHVAALSGGALVVEVSTGHPDSAALARGDCELAFLENRQLAQTDSLFSMFSLPFLYDDAAHMSRALNSEDLLKPLTERLAEKKMTPLAAFYRGGVYLATNRKTLRTPADFKDLTVGMDAENPDGLAVLRALGAQPQPFSPEKMPARLGEKVQAPKKASSRKNDASLTVEAVEVTLAQAQALPGDPTELLLSSYSSAPLWLLANADTYGSLSDSERAVLLEAEAGLLYDLEQAAEQRERQQLEMLQKTGMRLGELERLLLAKTVYEDAQPDGYQPPDYFDRRLYNRIQTFS